MLGVSRRTAQRWSSHGLPGDEMANMARVVHPHDPALAAEIVAALGMTLEGAGIIPPAPAPPPPPPPDWVVDAVVCATAEAMEMMPRQVRPGLHAAFLRAKEIGLTVDVIERALRSKPRTAEPTPPEAMAAPAPKRKSTRG
jgi:hypothetical protein